MAVKRVLSVPEIVLSTAREETGAFPVVVHVTFGAGTPVEIQLNRTESEFEK